jgi:hypothetical protein
VFYFCGCGCVSVLSLQEYFPAKMTVAEAETAPQPKYLDAVEYTDGYLFWPKLTPSLMIEEGEQRVAYYYVPLVSKPVLEEWLKEYRRRGPEAEYSFAKCRVIVRFYPKELQHQFPDAAAGTFDRDNPFTPYSIRSKAETFNRLSEDPLDAMAAHTKNFDAGRLVKVVNGSQMDSPRMFLILSAIGLLSLLPLVIRGLTAGFQDLWPVRPKKKAAETILTVLPVEEEPNTADYYYHKQGRTIGPVSLTQLRAMARTGRLRAEDRVWVAARKAWCRADRVKGLFRD